MGDSLRNRLYQIEMAQAKLADEYTGGAYAGGRRYRRRGGAFAGGAKRKSTVRKHSSRKSVRKSTGRKHASRKSMKKSTGRKRKSTLRGRPSSKGHWTFSAKRKSRGSIKRKSAKGSMKRVSMTLARRASGKHKSVKRRSMKHKSERGGCMDCADGSCACSGGAYTRKTTRPLNPYQKFVKANYAATRKELMHEHPHLTGRELNAMTLYTIGREWFCHEHEGPKHRSRIPERVMEMPSAPEDEMLIAAGFGRHRRRGRGISNF